VRQVASVAGEAGAALMEGGIQSFNLRLGAQPIEQCPLRGVEGV